MKVYLLDPCEIHPSASEMDRAPYHEIKQHAQLSAHKSFHLVQDPNLSDLVVAPIQNNGYGFFFERLTCSKLYLQHRDKVYVYCPDDFSYPFLPGIYPPTKNKWVTAGWTKGGHYITSHLHKFNFDVRQSKGRDLLFSFVGSSQTHPLRSALMCLNHQRAKLFDSNPPGDKQFWWEKKTFEESLDRFRETMLHSKFALCPRGISASSFRLFEAMEAGCVPVLISDNIVLPEGPDWASFIIRIPEKEVSRIPHILETLEGQCEEMGKLSRKAWEEYFSPQNSCITLMKWVESLHIGLNARRKWLAGRFYWASFLNLHLAKKRIKYLLKILSGSVCTIL